ncbi:MAG: hypothetical protein HN909_08635, partial [Phycisphaerales bacterium]|nr:hypothetical protein [Phycisphaerales bacterium]
CEALATLGDKAACTTLIEMVAGTKPASASKSRLRMAAVQIADRVKFNISAAAKTALASANPDGKRDLLLLLKADGSAEALTTAASLLNDATLRIDAIRTLADWDTPAAVEPLAAVLNKSLSNRERFLTVNAIAGHLPKAPAASRPAHAATVFTNLKTLLADADLGNAAINRLLTAIPAIAYYAHDEARAAADVAAKANPKLAPILNELLSQSLTRNLAKSAIATAPLNYRKDGQSSGPAAANDGDMTTYWDEENGKKRYRLRLTFPTKKTVGSIVLYGYKHHNFAPKTFRINSDAGTLAVVKTAKYTNNRFELPLKPATVKWVELNITGYYGPSPGIREVELYAPDTAPTKAAPKGLSWKQGKDTITLRNDGKTVWQYNYGAKLTKPYFSPIGPINAGDLSWIKPPDHIWHYGLWLSWKTINGINYWEERPAGFTKKKSAGKPTRKTAKRPTRKTPAPLASKGDPKPEGTTKIVSTQVAANADHSAKITQTLVYHPAKTPEAIVLREERTIAVSAPDNHGGYTLDWTMKFTAAVDVVLDRTPISGPNGKPHGGYAGLSMRFAKNFTDWHVIAIDSDKTNLDLTHKPSKGMDFSGTLDGKPCGMAMLDHPTNPRYPSPWYVVLKPEKSFSYFNAAILCHEPMTIKKGQTVTLRYRVAVHNGQWTADQLNAAEATYRATASANAPRALILTGANNHKWQETTPVLKAILETDNAFEVDVVTSPKGLDAKTLSIYDLIVSNWNSWVKRQSMANLEALWTPAARKAFEAAIASGTGHLTVHAGGSSFYDGTWPAYRKITLAYWEKDKTHHGKPLQFKLSLAKTDHPLAKTLKPFSHVDELWEEPGVAEGATVVMTATANNKTHANALAGQFKKGRCAATFLGHDAQKMAAPEFKTHLLTLAQWATRSKETTHAK